MYAASLWSRELRGRLPTRPGRPRLGSGFCTSARSFAPRCLQTVGHPSALALHFSRCDLLEGGLSPPRMCPCRAYIGIGAAANRADRSPPTPPGIRVRTGRFTRLRSSGQSGQAQLVERSGRERAVHRAAARAPPTSTVPGDLCSHRWRHATGGQLLVGGPAALVL